MKQAQRQSQLLYLVIVLSISMATRVVAGRSWCRHSAFVSHRVSRPLGAVVPRGSVDSLLGWERVEPASLVRLYHSSPIRTRNKKDDDDDDDTLVGKATKLAKSILPSKWFPSEAERNAKAERKRVKAEIKSQVKEVLKDAPLGLRMLGGMIGPILGGLASNLAQAATHQQDLVDQVYRRAAAYIQTDRAVEEALGSGVAMGRPFSQSSSSSSINGVTTMRVELAFEVSGSRQRGVGRVVSTGKANDDDGDDIVLQTLEVQVNGRIIPVSTSRSSKSARSSFASSNDGNVIEAEILDKDTKPK